MSGVVVLILRLLLAAGLYVFLAWAFLSLWQDLRRTSQLLASRKIPPIGLQMVTSDGSSSQLFFARADATIGRDPANEVHLEDSAVSARHARFCYHHGQWWVEDLNSTNGTFLNSERLKIPAVVMTGDVVRCGEVTFTVSLPGETVRSDQHPAETVRLENPQQ